MAIVCSAPDLNLSFKNRSPTPPLPLPPTRSEDKKALLRRFNIAFTVLFSIEAALKIIGQHLRGYFSSSWNWLDFIIVIISIVSLAVTSGNLRALRALRTLRALRALRAISRWEGMRLVVSALFRSIPSVANVLVVCGLIWLIFSIMGVQLFGGMFARCLDADGERLPVAVVPDRAACLAMAPNGTAWVNTDINFDHVPNAILALFQVATFEGWIEVMASAVDARGIDRQPQQENQFAAYFYFVAFIVAGTFFTLNLFVGVIIDTFARLKDQLEREGKGLFLTEGQQRYMEMVRKLTKSKPKAMVCTAGRRGGAGALRCLRGQRWRPSLAAIAGGCILLFTLAVILDFFSPFLAPHPSLLLTLPCSSPFLASHEPLPAFLHNRQSRQSRASDVCAPRSFSIPGLSPLSSSSSSPTP